MKKAKKPSRAIILSVFLLLVFWTSFAMSKSIDVLKYGTSPLAYLLVAVIPILVVCCFWDFRRFVGNVETISLAIVFLAMLPLVYIEATALFLITALIDGTLIFLTGIEWWLKR
jgi:hypothetical protein